MKRTIVVRCRYNGIGAAFTGRGSLWRNAGEVRLNGRLRDEHLNRTWIDILFEGKVFTEEWQIDMKRPHGTHSWLTRGELVEAWLHRREHQFASR